MEQAPQGLDPADALGLAEQLADSYREFCALHRVLLQEHLRQTQTLPNKIVGEAILATTLRLHRQRDAFFGAALEELGLRLQDL